jgi:hypothetical protein
MTNRHNVAPATIYAALAGRVSFQRVMPTGPNPISVGFSVLRSLLTVSRPGPFGTCSQDHSLLTPPLIRLERQGSGILTELEAHLGMYVETVSSAVAPTTLSRTEALAYWINVYNAGALVLAGRAQREGKDSILGIPGGFREKVIDVEGEVLSLDDIEHAKLRRFGDPRIHAALVCGSVSCPTLRSEPYRGDQIGDQLDDQLRHFLASGAMEADMSQGVARLSRVFLWFGGDFARPGHMPTLLPARSDRVLQALTPWMDPAIARWVDEVKPSVAYQGYDWGLRCTVR